MISRDGTSGLAKVLLLAVSWGAVAVACTQDVKIEDEVPSVQGARQPVPTGEDTSSLGEACDSIAERLESALGDLDCGGERPECPGLLRVAGALPCERINTSSLEACLEHIDEYDDCSDFSESPCIVTIEPGSCTSPEQRQPEGGVPGDGAVVAEAGAGAESGLPDAAGQLEGGGEPDATLPEAALPEAAAPEAAAPDATTEAGSDVALDGGAPDAPTG